MAGRRPTPQEQKALRGNPGKRKAPAAPPSATPVTDLTPPDWLGAAAAKEWARVAPELKAMGLLSVVDQAVLAAYCHGFERWMAYKKAVDEVTPALAIQMGLASAERESLKQLRMFAVELGFTPASRGRVQGAARKEEQEDPFEAWMRDRGQLQLVPGGKK